jgi:hypothetical protein
MTTIDITLNDLIAYATINYIAPRPTLDDIAIIDTIISEMRDTLDDISESILPATAFLTMTADDIDALDNRMTAHIESDAFYDRLLDIALARMI